MEHHGLPHNVGTFISVDSPQNGANIPVGVQFWADFFADEAAEAAAARDALLNPAPRQLSLYHLSLLAGGVANPDPMFAAFQNELAALGRLSDTATPRSVINGSSTQQNSGFLPGAQIIRWVYDSFLVDIRGNVWAVSNTVNTRVLQGEINVIWPLPDTFRNVFIQPCLPWDNAPGGLTATMAELAAVPAPYGDIEALYPSHCFIPSVSALDLAVNDPFFNIAGAGNLYELTPFDSVYFPIANQDHVQITPENAAWFMSEIIGPLAPPELTISVEADSIRLRWSPVFAATSYEVQSSLTASTGRRQSRQMRMSGQRRPPTFDTLLSGYCRAQLTVRGFRSKYKAPTIWPGLFASCGMTNLRAGDPLAVLREPMRKSLQFGIQRPRRFQAARTDKLVLKIVLELEHVAQIICAGETQPPIDIEWHREVRDLLANSLLNSAAYCTPVG